jgi:hypothetical protein
MPVSQPIALVHLASNACGMKLLLQLTILNQSTHLLLLLDSADKLLLQLQELMISAHMSVTQLLALVHLALNACGMKLLLQLTILFQVPMIPSQQLNSALGSETDITLLPMLMTSAKINQKMFATMLLIQTAYGMILSTHQLLKRRVSHTLSATGYIDQSMMRIQLLQQQLFLTHAMD